MASYVTPKRIDTTGHPLVQETTNIRLCFAIYIRLS